MRKGILGNKEVAIIGGGPGGLTLARLLQMKGQKVHVYERDVSRERRVQGATLNLNEPSGLRVIRGDARRTRTLTSSDGSEICDIARRDSCL